MKKISSIFLLSFLILNPLIIYSGSSSAIEEIMGSNPSVYEQIKETNKNKFFSKVFGTLSYTKEQTAKAFEWTSKNIDTILTKKGALKTLILLGPLFASYCYFFSPDPVEFLINKIVNATSYGAVKFANTTMDALKNNKEEIKGLVVDVMKESGEIQVTIQRNQEIGKMQATFDAIYTKPLLALTLIMYKGIELGIASGIPTLIHLYSQKQFSGK